MHMVTVRALRAFSHGSQTFKPGDPVEVDAVGAAVLARRGLVSLSAPSSGPTRTYGRRDMRARRPTQPSAPVSRASRRRGSPLDSPASTPADYERRDLVADDAD